MNYMVSLSIEVVVKLKKQTHAYYKLRRILYHVLSVGLALFLVILAEILHDFGTSDIKTCSLAPHSITETTRLVIFGVQTVLMWCLIVYMIKKVGKTYSNVIYNYFLVIFTMTASVSIVNILGFAGEFNLKNPGMYTAVALAVGATTGISMGISRLSNRRLIKHVLWKFGYKARRNIVLKEGSVEESSDSLINKNVYNFGDLFENLSKKTLMQILAVISLRFERHLDSDFRIENEAEYDQYEFDEELFEKMGVMYDMPRIGDSI